jgi:hypothetical protein
MQIGGPVNDSTRRGSGGEALITLAQRADLPARVRLLLDGLLERACTYFEPTILRTLDELEHALFRLAERSGNSMQQQERFSDLREVKLARADIAPRFLQHVEAQLARLRLPAATPPAGQAAAPAATRAPLELVDTAVFEVDIAQQEVTSRSEVRHSHALYLLGMRLAVMAGSPAPSQESLPLGPAQLTAAFRSAIEGIRLGNAERVLAYRLFDRMTMLPIGPFYEVVNGWLASQRVLPHLQLAAPLRRNTAPASPAAAPSPATPPAPAAAGGPPAGESPAASPATAAGAAQAPLPPPAGNAPPPGGDSELFLTLRHLLGERRRFEGKAPQAGAGPLAYASPDDLQGVLGSLQRSGQGTSRANHDSEHFRNTLLVKLRRISPDGRPLALAEEDADTVDLIGMLFDYITRNVRADSSARGLLTRLHVPVLRVALGDKTFFTRRDHPARELLNTIAETGARWIDDDDTDADLARKMQRAVDHVSTEYDGDVAVFENLLGDLSGHMQLLARRAEVVERRHIDAAKGRDKLEVARETAQAAIARTLAAGTPAPRVRALLERAWTDALALSALRHGAQSAEFEQRVAIARQLVQRGATAWSSTPADQALRQEIEAGLRQVGLHEDDVRGVLDHLLAPSDTADPVSARTLERADAALQARMPLGGEAAAPAPTAARDQAPALGAAERAMLERLRKTPFGTWFDFVQNQQGVLARRKLAWFSPMTGRCLFVNQRGARSEERTLEQLAREMVRGQVRLASDAQTSLIDRAWKAIVDMLRPRTTDDSPGASP